MMTWTKASPVLAIAAVFDALRLFFQMFWFFGPALAALYCTAKLSGGLSTWTLGLLGTKTAALACATGVGAVGTLGIEVIAPFGVIMAMAVGFVGWLTVGLILLTTNGRIFKENALWFASSLLVSEVPIVGSVPAITIALWKMYSRQIHTERTSFQKFQKEQAAAQAEEHNRQMAQLMQARAVQEAANQERYEEEAAADEEEQGIPERAKRAA